MRKLILIPQNYNLRRADPPVYLMRVPGVKRRTNVWRFSNGLFLLLTVGYATSAPIPERRQLRCEAWCTEFSCGNSHCRGCDGSTVTSSDRKQSTNVNCGGGAEDVAPGSKIGAHGLNCQPWCTKLSCGDPACKGCDGSKVVSDDLAQSTSVDCEAGLGVVKDIAASEAVDGSTSTCEPWCTELACGDYHCSSCDGSLVTSADLKQSTTVNCGAGGGAVSLVAVAMASANGKQCQAWCTDVMCAVEACKGCDGSKVISADLAQSTSVNCACGDGDSLTSAAAAAAHSTGNADVKCQPWCTRVNCADPNCQGCDGSVVMSADLKTCTRLNCGHPVKPVVRAAPKHAPPPLFLNPPPPSPHPPKPRLSPSPVPPPPPPPPQPSPPPSPLPPKPQVSDDKPHHGDKHHGSGHGKSALPTLREEDDGDDDEEEEEERITATPSTNGHPDQMHIVSDNLALLSEDLALLSGDPLLEIGLIALLALLVLLVLPVVALACRYALCARIRQEQKPAQPIFSSQDSYPQQPNVSKSQTKGKPRAVSRRDMQPLASDSDEETEGDEPIRSNRSTK